MHVISKKRLREYWQHHSGSESALKSWYRATTKAAWNNPAEMHGTFRHADIVGSCVVFNVGGNNTRVIARVEFRAKRVYVLYVLNHFDYDKGGWKNGCGTR